MIDINKLILSIFCLGATLSILFLGYAFDGSFDKFTLIYSAIPFGLFLAFVIDLKEGANK